jgi:hypothetical protein
MRQLALNLPQYGKVPETGLQIGNGNAIQSDTLGALISGFLNLTFYIAIFLVFIWFVWGAFEYILGEGKKESIFQAREKMKWALIGFVILVAMFLISMWARTIFPFIDVFYSTTTAPSLEGIQGPNCEPGKPC